MEAFDRTYRETTGRICTKIAAESQMVIRVVCGMGMVIKMLKIILIRSWKTYGNTKEDTSGQGQMSLCAGRKRVSSKEEISQSRAGVCKSYETLHGDCTVHLSGNSMESNAFLKECDFGLFENKSYEELSDCPEYQAWIDSNGTLPFPKESRRKALKNAAPEDSPSVWSRLCKEGFSRLPWLCMEEPS